MTTLENLKAICEAKSGAAFSLFAWQQNPEAEAWGVITLDGQAAAVWGDGAMQEQGLEGSAHLFVRNLTTGAPQGVQEALAEAGLSWRLDDVIYEPDSRILHYVWIWQEWGGVE